MALYVTLSLIFDSAVTSCLLFVYIDSCVDTFDVHESVHRNTTKKITNKTHYID